MKKMLLLLLTFVFCGQICLAKRAVSGVKMPTKEEFKFFDKAVKSGVVRTGEVFYIMLNYSGSVGFSYEEMPIFDSNFIRFLGVKRLIPAGMMPGKPGYLIYMFSAIASTKDSGTEIKIIPKIRAGLKVENYEYNAKITIIPYDIKGRRFPGGAVAGRRL